MPEDLEFSYRSIKGDVVFIAHQGRTVKTLKGKAAIRFLDQVTRASPDEAQLVMAKATGQFRFGNERAARGPTRAAGCGSTTT